MTHWKHVCDSRFHVARAFAATLLLASVAVGAAAQAAVKPTAPTIAFTVPISDMPKWKARGVQAVYYYEGEKGRYTKAQYEAAAAANELYFVTQPGDDLAAEAKQPYRLGWCQPDEPGNSNHRLLPGSKIDDYNATYKRLKAAGPNVPVWGTFSGSDLDNVYYTGRKGNDPNFYHAAQDGGWFAAVDVVLVDKYLSDRPDWSDAKACVGFWELHARILKRASAWSGGKPVVMILETNDRGTGNPCSAWLIDACLTNTLTVAATNGIKLGGFGWFAPVSAVGWGGFDGTKPEQAAMVTAWNRRLAGSTGSTQAVWLPIPPLAVGTAFPPDAQGPTTVPTTQPVTDNAPPGTTTAAQLAEIAAGVRALREQAARGFDLAAGGRIVPVPPPATQPAQ